MHFVFTTAIVSVASLAKFNGSIKAYGLYIIIGQIQMVASKPMDYILQNATKAYGLQININRFVLSMRLICVQTALFSKLFALCSTWNV